MSELGQQLKEARLQKGMSLDDVQEMTKIRKRYLEAIEAGDYKVLPGSFYVRAFIKTYAETVGLDPDLLLEDHKQEAPAEPEPTMEPVIQKRSSARSSERNVKWLSTTLMWIFPILIIAVIYLYANNASHPKSEKVDSSKVTEKQQDPTQKTAETTPPTDNTNKTAEGNTNKPDQKDTAGGNAGGNQTATPPAKDGTSSETTDNTSGNTTDNGTTTTTTTPADNQSVAVQQDGKKGKDTIFKVSAPQGTTVNVEIKATGKSWLEVYKGENIHGEKLSFGNTKEGDTLSFPLDSTGLYIKSGYSPATKITVGGQTVEDGKSTSRIRLKLADPGSMSTSGESSGGSDANGTNTDGSTNNNG
ncbi:helix-turn-helix domain-containing protein [Paenibacillus azoreducens]|uniref:XRE family transcriptional regulator n=1 Tax=Paenibacillus azoreducens TaxID=116718 RepID=A0A920CUW0_9BACL|nr:RodZ family helix-turn-helix domain-containing protein [Paenibacillus azoreducens]GIO49872.1 XRE family transcriptional regulator [Paenibacillus azoreducens]